MKSTTIVVALLLSVPTAQAQTNEEPELIQRLQDAFGEIYLFIALIAGAFGAVMMAVAGLVAMASAGNPERKAKAMSFLLYTALGLGIIVLAPFLVAMVQGFGA